MVRQLVILGTQKNAVFHWHVFFFLLLKSHVKFKIINNKSCTDSVLYSLFLLKMEICPFSDSKSESNQLISYPNNSLVKYNHKRCGF